MRRARRSAFTLLEVLIVAAIILVLAGAGGMTFMKYLDEAKKDRATMDVKTLSTACQAYQIKNGSPPATLATLAQADADGGKPYIDTQELLRDPWGGAYQYDANGAHNNGLKPDIWATAPDGALIGNWPK